MDVNIKFDEDSKDQTIDRIEFTQAVVNNLKDYLDNRPLVITDVKTNSMTIKEDGQLETFNISDEMDLELRLLVYVVVSAATFSTPKIVFHFSEDENDDLDITGMSLSDFSGIILGTNDTDFDYSMEVGCRYLRNLFRLKGIIRFTETSDSKPKELTLSANPNNSATIEDPDYIDDDTFSEFSNVVMKNEDVNSLSDLKKNAMLRGKNQKRLKMMRAKDPAAAKRRSKAAKMRWRKNKGAMLKGIRRFHKSAAGKKLDKLKGQFRASKD